MGFFDYLAKLWKTEEPARFIAGPSLAEGTVASDAFSPAAAMEAASKYPFIRACLEAKGDDLAGLPIYVRRGEERLDSHPAISLLRTPSRGSNWQFFLKQIVADYHLDGNAFFLFTGSKLIRLHPEQVAPICNEYGEISQFQYRPTNAVFDEIDLYHVRAISPKSDSRSLRGEGLIASLVLDLNSTYNAKTLASKQTKSGRFSFILSPSSPDNMFSEPAIKSMSANYRRLSEAGDGLLILNQGVKLDPVSATAKDLEFQELLRGAREAVLAIFGVPPARIGLETANFATQQQQMITYWQGLQGIASIFAYQFSDLCKRMGRPEDEFVFDFSGVEELQASKSAKMARLAQWVGMGFDPEESAKVEGIPIVPKYTGFGMDLALRAEAPEEADPAEIVQDAKSARAVEWRGFIERVHRPSELQLQRIMIQLLREQAKAISGAVGERSAKSLKNTKSFKDDFFASLVQVGQQFRARLDSVVEGISKTAFKAATEQIQNIPYSTNYPTQRVAAEMLGYLNQHTAEVAAKIVSDGIAADLTIAELQAQLISSPAFSASRALMISRTETTKIVNSAAEAGFSELKSAGIEVKKRWLSARDSSTRPSHRALDGQIVSDQGEFVTPSGQRVRYPGGFAQVSENVNCRCTIVAEI